MKTVTAINKNVRTSAQKARIPADIIRGMKALEAVEVLRYMPKSAAIHVKKTLDSAIANAKNNDGLDINTLFVSEIRVNDGQMYKRYKEGSKGSYKPFERRTCHIYVTLGDVSSSLKEEVGGKKDEEKTKIKNSKSEEPKTAQGSQPKAETKAKVAKKSTKATTVKKSSTKK